MAALGSLVVSLAMDTAKFTGDIGKAGQQMARLTAEAGKIGAAIGASVVAGVQSIGRLVAASVAANVEMGRLAELSNVSAEEFSRLAIGARAAGISQEKLADIFKDTQDKVGDFLQNGAGPLKDFFDNIGPRVGVTADQFRNLSGPQALGLYVQSLEKANLTQSEMVFFMEAIASDSALLLPLLRDGAAGFDKYSQAAERLGATLSDDVVAQSQVMRDNFMLVDLAKQGLANRITRELLPALTSMTSRILGSAEAAAMLDRVARIAASGMKVLASAGAIIVGVFDTLGTAVGGALAAIVAAIQGRFVDAWNIAKGTVTDFGSNVRSTAATVASIWDGTVAQIQSKAPALGAGIASPTRKAAEKIKRDRQAIKNEIDRVQEVLSNLRFEVSTQGLDEGLRAQVNAARELAALGGNAQQIAEVVELTRAQQEFKASIDAAAEAQRNQADIMSQGATIAQEMRTPIEILADRYRQLEFLLSKGAISQDTYSRAVQRAAGEYQTAMEAMQEQNDKFGERMAENIQGFLGDSLQKAMEGNFKSIGNAFVSMINRMVAEAIAADLSRLIFGGASGSQGTMGLFQQLLNFLPGMFGGRAIGGPVTAGNLYKTNEHRGGAYPITDEWFVPATAGTVVPGSKMGGMNITVNVKATPGMSRQTALQQGRDIGRGIQLATARNG